MPKVPGMPAGDRHDNRRLTTAAGQTFGLGALVVLDGSGNVTECGADPALIYGMALEPAGKDPEGTYTIVAVAYEGQKFWLECTSNPTIAANQSQSYGVVKDADGIWVVDLTDTTNKRVFVHQVDEDTHRVLVSVLAANRQVAP